MCGADALGLGTERGLSGVLRAVTRERPRGSTTARWAWLRPVVGGEFAR